MEEERDRAKVHCWEGLKVGIRYYWKGSARGSQEGLKVGIRCVAGKGGSIRGRRCVAGKGGGHGRA